MGGAPMHVIVSDAVAARWPDVASALADLPREPAASNGRRPVHLVTFDELFVDGTPTPPLVIGPDDPRRFIDAVEAGIVGYVTAPPDLDELTTAMALVADGVAYVPPHLLGTLLRHTVTRIRTSGAATTALERLTGREREVADAIAAGLDRRQTADRLGISPETVRTHLQRIMRKLGVHSQAALVALLHGAPVQTTDLDREEGNAR